MAQPCVAPTSPRSPRQHSAVWICTSPAGGGKAPRAGGEALSYEDWAPALPWGRSPCCHSGSGGGLCEAVTIQQRPAMSGDSPPTLAKGSSMGGLKSAACVASFTGTPTPPSGHLLTASHEPRQVHTQSPFFDRCHTEPP